MSKQATNEGSFWQCLAPTITGGACVVAAGWTVCVSQPWAASLWTISAGFFIYTCLIFISIVSAV